ncbi:MAG: hypothetical protein ABIM89_00660 [Mycobacteriales bacterium]
MSLDRRMRDGVTHVAASIAPDVEAHLTRTLRRFRRRRTTRRVALAALAAVVIAGVPALQGAFDRGDGPLVAGANPNAQARALLEGTWVSPVATKLQVTDVLAAAGLGQHVDVVSLEMGLPVVWLLHFEATGYRARSASESLYDHGDWSVNGSTLTLRPAECPCVLTFNWRIDQDRLRLELLTDESPDLKGVPDEAYARALYTTVPFTRSRFGTPKPATP